MLYADVILPLPLQGTYTYAIPLEFKNKEDYDKINEFDSLTIDNLYEALDSGIIKFKASGYEFEAIADISDRDKEMIKKGGYLNFIKNSN